jgi:hypothetical protein
VSNKPALLNHFNACSLGLTPIHSNRIEHCRLHGSRQMMRRNRVCKKRPRPAGSCRSQGRLLPGAWGLETGSPFLTPLASIRFLANSI